MKKKMIKSLALLLAVVMAIGQCSLVTFADTIEILQVTEAEEEPSEESTEESEEDPTSESSEEITEEITEEILQEEIVADETPDAEDNETGTSETEVLKAEEYAAADVDEDLCDIIQGLPGLNKGSDYIPEEIIVSVHGGAAGLFSYVYDDEDLESDYSFLEELEAEPLMRITADEGATTDETEATMKSVESEIAGATEINVPINETDHDGISAEDSTAIVDDIIHTEMTGKSYGPDPNAALGDDLVDFDTYFENDDDDEESFCGIDSSVFEEYADEDIDYASMDCQILLVYAEGRNTRSSLNVIVEKLNKLDLVESAELNIVTELAETQAEEVVSTVAEAIEEGAGTEEHTADEVPDLTSSVQNDNEVDAMTVDGAEIYGEYSAPDYTGEQWAYKTMSAESKFKDNITVGVDDPDAVGEKKVNWDEYDDDGKAKPIIDTSVNEAVIAVVDSGIDYEHEDLKNVMWTDGDNTSKYPKFAQEYGGRYGYNVVSKNTAGVAYDPKDIMDDNSHGTHCAGIIAAEWNKSGISGITSGVKLMGVKIFNDSGRCTTDNIIRGLAYVSEALSEGVNIVAVNNSYGGSIDSEAINQCVYEIGNKGAVCIFAAGNANTNNDYVPTTGTDLANNPYVVTVDNNNYLGRFASSTCYGIKTTHVSAPGEDILSTIPSSMAGVDILNSGVATQSSGSGVRPAVSKVCKSNDYLTYDSFDGEIYYFKSTPGEVGTDMDEYTYFSYSGGNPLATTTEVKIVRDIGVGGTDGIFIRSKTDNGLTRLDVGYNTDDIEGNIPKYIAFNYKVNAVPENTEFLVIEAAYLDENGEFKSLWPVNEQVPEGWQNCTLALPDDIKEQKIIFVFEAYTKDSELIKKGVTISIDNVIMTDDAVAYGYKSGTSMATPLVTGEAALLMTKFYDNSTDGDKHKKRAANVAARIKGSVQRLENDAERVQSGGIVRVDYALRGKTVPVINSAEITEEGGKKYVTLYGYFMDGVAIEGDTAAKPSSVTVDDNAVDIISWDANSVKFEATDKTETGEHLFTVTSAKGTGRAYKEIRYDENMFTRIPFADSLKMEMLWGTPLKMQALMDKMYLLVENVLTHNIEVWVHDLSDTEGNWTLIKTFDDSCNAVSMTAWSADLIVTQKDSDDKTHIWTYDAQGGYWLDNTLENVSEYATDYNICASEKEMVLSVTIKQEEAKYINEVYYITPGTCKVEQSTVIPAAYSKYKAGLISYDSDFYMIGGIGSDSAESKTILKIFRQYKGNTLEMSVTIANEDIYKGINLRKDQDLSVNSAAVVKGGVMLSGPVVTSGEIITADTYMISYDFGGAMVPQKAFVSTSKMSRICCEAYKGKYYVIAITANAEDGWVMACVNAETYKPYQDEEGKGGGDDSYIPTGGTGGSAGTGTSGNLPSYVAATGTWSKITDANGHTIYRFTNPDGTQAANCWRAIATSTWKGNKPNAGDSQYYWFRFDVNGNMVTGWYTDEKGRMYYMDPTQGDHYGTMLLGWQFIGGKWLYFRESPGSDQGSWDMTRIKDE